MREFLRFPEDFDEKWIYGEDEALFSINANFWSQKLSSEEFGLHNRHRFSNMYWTHFHDLREAWRASKIKKMAHDAIRLPWVRK